MDTRQDDTTAPVNTSEYIIPYSDVKINTNEEDIIMSTQTIKAEIINNVLVAMSLYIMEQQTSKCNAAGVSKGEYGGNNYTSSRKKG